MGFGAAGRHTHTWVGCRARGVGCQSGGDLPQPPGGRPGSPRPPRSLRRPKGGGGGVELAARAVRPASPANATTWGGLAGEAALSPSASEAQTVRKSGLSVNALPWNEGKPANLPCQPPSCAHTAAIPVALPYPPHPPIVPLSSCQAIPYWHAPIGAMTAQPPLPARAQLTSTYAGVPPWLLRMPPSTTPLQAAPLPTPAVPLPNPGVQPLPRSPIPVIGRIRAQAAGPNCTLASAPSLHGPLRGSPSKPGATRPRAGGVAGAATTPAITTHTATRPTVAATRSFSLHH